MNDDELRREVERLRNEVDALHRRLEAVESEPPSESGESDGVDGPDEQTATGEIETTEAESDDPSASPDSAVTKSTGGETLSDRLAADRDWELALGVRWLGLVGALALVVGVVFVRLAIEIGLLGPGGRVALGTLTGVGLLAGGRFAATRQGYRRWGRIAAGTGLAIAYFSVYAAYGFESYRDAIGTPLWAALAALTALVAVAAIVSVRDRAPFVVGEAFLLGYVTATLSTDAATVVLTPAYVLLLGGGSSQSRRSDLRLLSASTFATYGVLLLWLVDLEPPATAIVWPASPPSLSSWSGRTCSAGRMSTPNSSPRTAGSIAPGWPSPPSPTPVSRRCFSRSLSGKGFPR